MFPWLFFWRHRHTPTPDELDQQAGTSSHSELLPAEQNMPESTSMPLEMRSGPNQKPLHALVVVSSNAAPALEIGRDASDLQLKPVLVLPSIHDRMAPEGEITEKQSIVILPASGEEVADIAESARAAYFASGRYTSSEPNRARLTSPNQIVRKQRKQSTSPAQQDIADSTLDQPQDRRLVERK